TAPVPPSWPLLSSHDVMPGPPATSVQENVVPTNWPCSHTPPTVGETIVAAGTDAPPQLIVTEPPRGGAGGPKEDAAVVIKTFANDGAVKFDPAPPLVKESDGPPPPPPK